MSDEKTYELMAEGVCTVRCTKTPEYTETNSGAPQLLLHLEIQDGPYAGKPKLVFLSLNSNVSEGKKKAAIEYTKEKLDALGWDGDLDFKTPLNAVARAVIKHDTYKGKTSDKLEIVTTQEIQFEAKKADPAAVAKAKAAFKALGVAKKEADLPF